jgi:hypothetical protein
MHDESNELVGELREEKCFRIWMLRGSRAWGRVIKMDRGAPEGDGWGYGGKPFGTFGSRRNHRGFPLAHVLGRSPQAWPLAAGIDSAAARTRGPPISSSRFSRGRGKRGSFYRRVLFARAGKMRPGLGRSGQIVGRGRRNCHGTGR